ncbi:MAG: chemotaxis protein CheX [Acidobacteriaceae bacterium]
MVAGPMQALDTAVKEIFEQMLGVECKQQPLKTMSQPVSAIIGLTGALSGSCTLSARPADVMAISLYLEAYPLPPMDSMLQDAASLSNTMLDAFGELGNMIAGGWKGRLQGLDSGCFLSVPSIVYGSDYVLQSGGSVLLVKRSYRFAEFEIQVAIRGDIDPL